MSFFFSAVKRQILAFQGAGSGLWAYNSSDKVIGDVRTSIYCSITVWALYQAYRRIDDDRGRSYELSQSAVKCMRGILQCWLAQAAQIEKFKQQQASERALHSKFHLETGNEIISEKNYGHLQVRRDGLLMQVVKFFVTEG
jgi:phosphorylase kinase alpha/beta subunit